MHSPFYLRQVYVRKERRKQDGKVESMNIEPAVKCTKVLNKTKKAFWVINNLADQRCKYFSLFASLETQRGKVPYLKATVSL